MFIRNDIDDEAVGGGSGELCEPEPSLVAQPDARRFNWRDLWPVSDRLRAYFDAGQGQDKPFWRRTDRFVEGRPAAAAGFWTAKPPSAEVVAIVGLNFEARILANRSVRAVLLRADPTALSASITGANRGVISFGICGGLAPGLKAGACIIASCIHDGARTWRTDEAWSKHLLRSIPGAVIAPILGVDAPVIAAAEKRRLYEKFGAAAVDMESHLAAAAATARRSPFAAIRVVADDARCALPDAALAGRRIDGSIDAPAVLRALFDNPSDLAPLIRLALQTRLACATLLRLSELLGERMGLPP